MYLPPLRSIEAQEYEQNLSRLIRPDQIIVASQTDTASQIMSVFQYYGKRVEKIETKYVTAAMQIISFSEGTTRRAVLSGKIAINDTDSGTVLQQVVNFTVHPNGLLFVPRISDEEPQTEGYLTYSDLEEQRVFIDSTIATLTE